MMHRDKKLREYVTDSCVGREEYIEFYLFKKMSTIVIKFK